MRFTPDHEWVELDGDQAVIGITRHAAEALGDLVYLEVTEPGTHVGKGDVIGVVESVKAASEIYSPLSGTIVVANQKAIEDPTLVSQAPEGDGWLARLQPDDPADIETLLDADAYQALLD